MQVLFLFFSNFFEILFSRLPSDPSDQIEDTCQVRQQPADGHGPPDPHNPDGRNGGEQIGQGDAGSQGNDSEHHGNPRLPDRPVEAVEEEEAADTVVEGSLDMQIPDALGDDGGRKFDSSINQKTLTGPIKPVFFCQF